MLGHRRRLLLDSVLTHVIGASARQGHAPSLFLYLENGTMATPFLSQGGQIIGHPGFRGLSDALLRQRIARLTRAAGGRVGALLLAPPPAASFPNGSWASWRMFHYDERIRQTVVVALKKELIGHQLIVADERRSGRQHDWVLLLREDAHFFGPLELSRFQPGAVHGKGCARYGGWNDHLWLIGREHAVTVRDCGRPSLVAPHLAAISSPGCR